MPKLLIVATVPMSFPFFLPFADHFRRERWTVGALTGTLEGFRWHDRFDAVHSAPWSRRPRSPVAVLRAAARVRETVARGGYDIVHVHTSVASFVTRFALRNRDRGGGPVVVFTAHGFPFHPGGAPVTNLAFLAAEKLAARWADWLVVMNGEDEAAARRWRFVPPDRIRRMPGIGVNLDHYSPERVGPDEAGKLREGLGIGDAPFVLMVGEFIPRKRHEDLLHAFATLSADPALSGAHLVFAGRGPLLDRNVRLAAALGLAGRTHFLGVRTDVHVLMRAASALVLPSSHEGLPRCVLEAMAMGLPVVASRIRGTAELLEGGCGTLFDAGDTVALAAGLRRVLLDRPAALEDARRARGRSARYDERVVIAMHEALYADALAARAASAGRRAPERAARGRAAVGTAKSA